MDPPSFGHGPKDELWKIEEDFLELIELCKQVLSDKPLFVLINGYTAGYSAIAYENNLKYILEKHSGTFEMGELAIRESSGDRLLPCGIFARWQKN
jgi:23S rRNA (cytosine1962-C5)-methyltransferase